MIQKRRSLVENDDIHVIAVQHGNELGRQFRRVAERGICQAIAVDANRDVDVAVRLPALTGLGAEQVGLEDLRPRVRSIGPARPRSNNRAAGADQFDFVVLAAPNLANTPATTRLHRTAWNG